MARDSYLMLFGVPEPTLEDVTKLARKRPIAKINRGAFVIGLRSASEYWNVVLGFRAGLPSSQLTFCLMQADQDIPTVFPDGGADTAAAEKVIEGRW